MPTGRLDLFIAKLPVNTVVLTLNCSEGSSELLSLPRGGAKLTLVRGSEKQPIQLEILEGRECFADFMEMNYALAKRFQLRALRRYSLKYDPDERTLTISPSPLSETIAPVTPGAVGANTVSVGFELLSRLGIPERQGMLLNVRAGRNSAKFRLHVPSNLSDDRLRLSAPWLQKWKLAANRPHKLQYDQRNGTLSLAPAQR
ncbi:hypothetical protein ACF3MZ_11085 [Paenibacillaceae bacterium WGS1546]|uniref:hypothetical protein n=1 Tax=Cohnella sp. WGS1546 TaxID=3366810 RepID=UPI00372D1DF1